MNIEENIDYILLNIVKYYTKSGFNTICIQYDNTPSDRLLLEIIRHNLDKFHEVTVECDFNKYEDFFGKLLTSEEKEKFNFRDYSLVNDKYMNEYRICAKNKLYCKSFLIYNYDRNQLYPLFDYSNQEILTLLNFYHITETDLTDEHYGIQDKNLKLLEKYLFNFDDFSKEPAEDRAKVLDYARRQSMLKLKTIPSLSTMQKMEDYT